MEEQGVDIVAEMEVPSIHRFFIINYMKINHHGEACINTTIVEYSVQIAERLKEYIVGTVDQYSPFLFHYIPENESANKQYYDSLSGNYIKAFYAEFLSHTDFKAFCNGLEFIKTITHSCSKYVYSGVEYLQNVDALPHEKIDF